MRFVGFVSGIGVLLCKVNYFFSICNAFAAVFLFYVRLSVILYVRKVYSLTAFPSFDSSESKFDSSEEFSELRWCVGEEAGIRGR